ncbi:10681_t:CDS:10 [Ambispora gerdemannii]|uniref:10681_t:CDS:1 n=1 Tax=Ambispora gerdemannii TaxID=144530 RepID=A0A9N8VH82_9GLOM|nr:10681_t:CDS:10 [Ambispora gerdemannii]
MSPSSSLNTLQDSSESATTSSTPLTTSSPTFPPTHSTTTDLNDEVDSLYHKIFADRGPNKRKIKMKAIDQIALDATADDDSEYQASEKETEQYDTDSATIVSGNNSGQDVEVDIETETETASRAKVRGSNDSETIDPEDTDVLVKNFLKKWKLEDPGICCICLEGATTESNMLVYCDGDECEVVCHQECYGIINLPGSDEPWYCDRCLASAPESVSCILCPNKNGAFRRLKEGERSGGWVHIVCALWMPGMWVGNNIEITNITIENVDQKNWSKICSVCPTEIASEGATIHCDAGGCKNFLHVTCAHSMTLLECIDDDPNISDPYFVYCQSHGSHGPAKLNDWEKWYRRRDKFLEKIRSKENFSRAQKMASVDDDFGASLRELFEDKYVGYRKRRETRIASSRRRVAEATSVVNILKEQKEKAKSAESEHDAKIEEARKEQEALQNYLSSVRESLQLCSRLIYAFPMQLNWAESNANRERDTVDQFNDLLSRPVVWEPKAAIIARSIDVENLDTSSMTPIGVKPLVVPQTTTPRRRGRQSTGRRTRKVGRRSKKVADEKSANVVTPEPKTSSDVGSSTKPPPKKKGRKSKKQKELEEQQRKLEEEQQLLEEQQQAEEAQNDDEEQSQEHENMEFEEDHSDDKEETSATKDSDTIEINRENENMDIDMEETIEINHETEKAGESEFVFQRIVFENHRLVLKDQRENEYQKSQQQKQQQNLYENSHNNSHMYHNNHHVSSISSPYSYNNNSYKSNNQNRYNSPPARSAPVSPSSRPFAYSNQIPYHISPSPPPPHTPVANSVASSVTPTSATSTAATSTAATSTAATPATSTRTATTSTQHVKRKFDTVTREQTSSASDNELSDAEETNEVIEVERPQKMIKRGRRITKVGRPLKNRKLIGRPTKKPQQKPIKVKLPQPICTVCDKIEPPLNDQAPESYVTPTKSRAKSILNGRDKVHRMIRCGFCEKWFHLACINPPRKTMPSPGFVWQCEECDTQLH